MKLVMCLECLDVISLTRDERACECGKTKGKYINRSLAYVKGNRAVSIGISTPEMFKALALMQDAPKDATREWYENNLNILCWMRPNHGPGNPHTLHLIEHTRFIKANTPTPGSHDAVRQGCVCPHPDNEYGRGFQYEDQTHFYVAHNCPTHNPSTL